MATQHNNGSDLDPNPIGLETPEPETEKFGTSGCAIPIGVERKEPETEKSGSLDCTIPIGVETKVPETEKFGTLDCVIPIGVEIQEPETEKFGSLDCTIPIGVETKVPETEKFETLDCVIPIGVEIQELETEKFGSLDCAIPFGVETLEPETEKFGTLECEIPSGVETLEPETEKFGTLDCDIPIEEGVEKITLVGTSLTIEENGDMEESESENSDTECSSSSSSGSGSSSSSSSSDSDDDDEEEEEKKEEVEEGEISGSDGDKMVSCGIVDDDIDDDDDDVAGGPIRSNNELQNLPPVPPVDVTLEPHHQMLPVGVVMSVLGAQVIVEGVEKHEPLNEGSILWLTESRKPLGLVDEIFGPVKNPYYVVRYNSENEVPAGIHGGTLISFVPEFANHVLNNNKDIYKKGYDASGANDEELSDEVEFSDDEKEAEYRRMQKVTKRGINDQNPGKRKNNRKKVSPKERVVSAIPDAPATPFLDHGNSSPFSGIGQGHFGRTTTFPPSNAGPNFATNGVWTNGTSLPQQPQPVLRPNGFPTNGISWYPQNTQISHQLPVPQGNPFQQQFHPSQGSLSTTLLPGVQANILAQLLYAQGLVSQNQLTFGMNSPFPQIQPTMSAAQQGFPSTELQPERNLNLHSSTNSGAPHQFQRGSSARRGRKAFHGGGRKGWRPAK